MKQGGHRKEPWQRHTAMMRRESNSDDGGEEEVSSSKESYDQSTESESHDNPPVADARATGDDRSEDEESTSAGLHNIPMRLTIDNHVYVRRNCKNNRMYFYCATRGCKASLVVDPITNTYRKIVVVHNHSEGLAERIRRDNMTEIALRQFVREHQTLESHRIYALLLDEHHRDPSKFPHIENITAKRIENIKGQLAGEIARNALETLLPEHLSEVNGTPFLALQTVHPVVLIFATTSSLAHTRSSPAILLMKLRLEGVLLTNVYCLYAPDRGHWRPTVWVLFKEATSLPWTQLRWLLETGTKEPGEFQPYSRKWVIPGTAKYFNVLRNLTRDKDTFSGIAASYQRQITKITAGITERSEQEALQNFFERLSFCNVSTMEPQLAHLERTCNAEVCRAIFAWRSRFADHKSLYYITSRCGDEQISSIYIANKQRERQVCPSDQALIESIHEQYRTYLCPP